MAYRIRAGALAWALAALGCGGAPEPPAASREVTAEPADATVMFIDIEGTLDELRALRGIDGLELERGASNAGGDRFHVGGYVRRRSALREVEARGLLVRIVMDEAAARRRMAAEQEAMQRAAAGD